MGRSAALRAASTTASGTNRRAVAAQRRGIQLPGPARARRRAVCSQMVQDQNYYRHDMAENKWLLDTMFNEQLQALQKTQMAAAREMKFDERYGFDPYRDYHTTDKGPTYWRKTASAYAEQTEHSLLRPTRHSVPIALGERLPRHKQIDKTASSSAMLQQQMDDQRVHRPRRDAKAYCARSRSRATGSNRLRAAARQHSGQDVWPEQRREREQESAQRAVLTSSASRKMTSLTTTPGTTITTTPCTPTWATCPVESRHGKTRARVCCPRASTMTACLSTTSTTSSGSRRGGGERAHLDRGARETQPQHAHRRDLRKH